MVLLLTSSSLGIAEMVYAEPDQKRELDSLREGEGYDKVVELFQERVSYQALSLARQRKFIYALIFLAALLIFAFVLLLRNSKKRRLANDLLALKSLRSQIDPHFIFNALNSVNGFISSNSIPEANKYLADFSRLMRIVMENSQMDFVPLTEEISALKLYLSLEHFRFKDSFEYDLIVAKTIDPDQYRVPPMLVQPYIENAIWHGLRYKKELGQLSVAIEKSSTHILLRISDNGIGRLQSQKLKTTNQKTHESTGMKNTEERIGMLSRIYGSDISVEVKDLMEAEKSGTVVLIKIPLDLAEEII